MKVAMTLSASLAYSALALGGEEPSSTTVGAKEHISSVQTAEPTNGVLCLTFDDSRFADWEAALPIFAAHKAHATFFAYHAIDDKAIAALPPFSSPTEEK